MAVSISLSTGDQPRSSIIIALALAMLSLIEFIGFIHRTASGLQADQLIQRLGRQLRGDMRRLRSSDGMPDREWKSLRWRRSARGRCRLSMTSQQEGYVQTVDYGLLAECLKQHDALALLRVRPSDFVVVGVELMALWPAETIDQAPLETLLHEAITMGPVRTPIQDPEFPTTQIQQIAARALSTGINDPGTAITCIDWLTLALAELVDAELPGRLVLDAQGNARLLIRPIDFSYLVNLVYAPMRQFMSHDLQVSSCLLESLNRLAALTKRRDRLEILRGEGARVWKQVGLEQHTDHDAAPINQRYKRLCSRTR